MEMCNVSNKYDNVVVQQLFVHHSLQTDWIRSHTPQQNDLQSAPKRVSQKYFILKIRIEIQFGYFWKAEACTYVARQKYSKTEFTCQDQEHLDKKQEIKCKICV